ncbi:MAG TPA: serine/threonine-protein kinase, partial [Phototrophicaceae bacterium]|nr:serine/threonine-protein kinase [Phototrophicaceae bacterium]
VMRYVSGGSLEDMLEAGPLEPEDAMRLARAVAQALDYAHENKVVHLDLKPSNILLDSYQLPYLADFGLATVMGPEGRAANPGSGTLLYMAPEQLTAEQLDQRADVYSFSIMLFHMMTGQLPFDATIPLALKQIQMNEPLPGVEEVQPNLPPAITTILRSGTEVDVNKRPATLGSIVTAIEDALGMSTKASTRSAPAAASRAPVRPEDLVTRTEPADDLLTGALDNLVTRTAPTDDSILKDIMSGPLDGLITGPQERQKPNEGDVTRIDLDDLVTQLDVSPEAMAKREAVDIYTRAYRAWLHGRGRFLLGITHFMLINDYYVNAEQHNLDIDESGKTMMLRGALEFDHDIDVWWSRLNDESRRMVALHALLSENPSARVRALQRLETLPDAEPPQIPRLVGQQLQVETNSAAQFAAIRVLEIRGKSKPTVSVVSGDGTMLSTARIRLQLSAPNDWRESVFSPEIDSLLANLALDTEKPEIAEAAARAIGRIRSEAAVRVLAEHQRTGDHGALHALALVRDEAPSLPKSVSPQVRIYTWLNNTWRRLTDDPIQAVWRYVAAAIFAGISVWWYAYSEISDASIFFAERWGKSLTTGITFGVVYGLVILFAAEVPERLRGFWPWWARLLLNIILGLATGILVWVVFDWFFLYYQPAPEDFNAIILGGVGAAAAFALGVVFDIPGWLGAIWAAIMTFIPLYVTAVNYMPPLIYVRPDETIQEYAIPIAILIAIGAYLPQLIRDGLKLWRRVRRPAKPTTPAQPVQPATAST